ncbi:hypothetical protein [Aliikangiella maris]|uniref:Uncharacterized protein n=2 Tax=Aliikangiella maris TaxID=3162458 RepID=A0ABV2BU31_9GAMM
MKIYERIARYLLGIIYLFGAVDGFMFLVFDMYIHGKPHESFTFLIELQKTTYFWAFMKLLQFLGALSLLTNYKPALGLTLLTPISAILCLFYIFELQWYIAASVITSATLVLFWAYADNFKSLLIKPVIGKSTTQEAIVDKPITDGQ